MSEAKTGDTVAIHYTGTLETGEEFDSSVGRDPLRFTLGSGQVIPGFDAGVTGMKMGETKTINIAAEEAYGPHRPELVQEVPRGDIPAHIEIAEGVQLQAGNDDQSFVVTVTSFNEETVTLDANHPLAGKALTFEIELVSIG